MIKLPRPGPMWRRLCWRLNRGAGAIILRYHRIAEPPHDPWPVCVSPRHFDEQLHVMRRHATIVPLADLALPQALELKIKGRMNRWRFDGSTGARGGDRGQRLRAHHELWHLLQPMQAIESWEVLDELRRRVKQEPGVRPPQRALDADEVLASVDNGLVEVGARSVNRPALPYLDARAQEEEIRQSKTHSEGLLDRPVRAFAYPFGRYASQTRTLVRDAGFRLRLHLRRPTSSTAGASATRCLGVYVGDWDGAEFEKHLTGASVTP